MERSEFEVGRPLQAKLYDWPELDRALWAESTRPVDILSERPPAATWREATSRSVAKAYGRWLGWLEANHDFDRGVYPVERVTDEHLGAYVIYLRACTAPQTVASHLRGLVMALKAMQPDANIGRLWDIVNRLSRNVQPVRRKRHRIVHARRLLAFGQALMTDASPMDQLMAAVRHRDGLIISLLADRPIRLRSLQLMQVGRHLVRGEDHYSLRFEPAETKTGKEIDLHLADELTEYIDEYLEIHRPILLARAKPREDDITDEKPSKACWISRFGTQMAASSLHARIKELTGKHFDHPINPHLFRDCVATSIALDDPNHLDITMTLLGHTTRSTSERYYNHALCRQAAGLHHRMVTNLRKDLRREEAGKVLKPRPGKG